MMPEHFDNTYDSNEAIYFIITDTVYPTHTQPLKPTKIKNTNNTWLSKKIYTNQSSHTILCTPLVDTLAKTRQW